MCHLNKNKKINIIFILLIAIVGFLVYANALGNSFVWDDRGLIVENPYVKSWRHLLRIFSIDLFHGVWESSNYYRPLQTLSYMVDYSLWHLKPSGYHAINLISHIFNACMVYLLVNLISRNRKISLITGLLFVVHPVHTAAVAYISGRADLIVASFFLLSIYLFIKSVYHQDLKRNLFYMVSLFSFILALLSKEIAIILPLIVVLYDLTFKEGERLSLGTRIRKRYLAYFIVAGVYIFLRLTVLNFILEEPLFASSTPLYLRLLTMSKVIITYIRLLFLPLGLHMEWDVQPATSFFDGMVLISLGTLVLIWLIAIKGYRYSKSIFFASFWFFITLIPSSNLVPLTTYLAEHWLYLASIGFFMILAIGIVKVVELRPTSPFYKKIAVSFVALLLIFYSFVTMKRTGDWSDEITIFQDTLRYSPDNQRVHNNLGVAYAEKGLLNEALKEFEELLRLRPDRSETYSNRGVVYTKLGRAADAIDAFKEALRLKPDFAEAHHNLALAYAEKGWLDEAVSEYKEALRLNPYIAKGYNNLGVVYEKKDLFDEAISCYKEALELDPGFAEVHKNLGGVYYKQRLFHKARVQWENVLEINPNYPGIQQNLLKLHKLGY